MERSVNISILFSKNKKIGSRIISAGTSFLSDRWDVPSHVALLVDERWVIESTLSSGIRMITYKKWKAINTTVKIVNLGVTTMAKIKLVYNPIKTKTYDYLGLMYFAYRLFLNLVIGLKIPTHNRFNSPKRYFCTEAVGMFINMDCSMVAPVQLLDVFEPLPKVD